MSQQQKMWTVDQVIAALRDGTAIPDDDLVELHPVIDGETGHSCMTVALYKWTLLHKPRGKA
jgi:hypothetical protein